MKRGLACAALATLLSVGAAAQAAQVETLRQAGPPDKRFNVVVLGDGYRNEDQAKLTTDATAIVDYLFSVTPLEQYAQFFNVKLVHVISKENGADNGSYGAERDTALGANYGCYNIDRLLCIDNGLAQAAAAADVPEVNFIMVLVNDTKYGGSGGTICAASSNESSFEILAHEVGHSLAKLADEYDYTGSLTPCDPKQDCPEANVTLRTQRDQIKWKDWIDPATPLPTPETQQYGDVAGLFDGARYVATGVYRPHLNCKMRDLGADYCSVCTEQFVRSIWTAENIQMIEGATPAQQAVQSDSCDAINLSIQTPPITPSTYKFVWSVDGDVQTETTSAIALSPAALMLGQHQVKVSVEDTTAMVRSDPDGVLKDEQAWTVSVGKSDCQPISGVGGAAGMSGAGAGGAPSGGAAGAAGGGAGGALAGAGGVAVSTGGVVSAPLSPAPPPPKTSGCGCALPGDTAPRGVWALSALALASVVRRRRARR